MPPLRKRKITEWNIERNRHAFEFRVDWTRDCQLLAHQFHFVGPESKMWSIQVAGGESPPQCIEFIGRDLFRLFVIKKDLPAFHISIPDYSFLRLEIVNDGVRGNVILALEKFRQPDDFAG